MSNTDRHPECHMRTALGNCNPIGGFCTSVNEPICEALHKASRPQGEWVAKDGVFYCSCCNNDSAGLSEDDVYVYEIPLPNYCKDCGAKMKG